MSRGIAVLWLALVMSGCASTVSIPVAPVQVLAAANWTLQGCIGIQSGEQNASGSIYWQHREHSDELLLTSPLGQGVARIVVSAAGAVLDMPNQPVRQAESSLWVGRCCKLIYGMDVLPADPSYASPDRDEDLPDDPFSKDRRKRKEGVEWNRDLPV